MLKFLYPFSCVIINFIFYKVPLFWSDRYFALILGAPSIPKLPRNTSFRRLWESGFSELMFLRDSLVESQFLCSKETRQKTSNSSASHSYHMGYCEPTRKEISTIALLSVLRRLTVLRFVFIVRLFCAYVFVLHIGCYHTLSMIVIYCINKYFIKSSFLQSAHVKCQFQNRDYL